MTLGHTIADVNDGLRGSLEDLCRRLLPSGKRDGAEWRAGGTHGGKGKSLGVHLHGPKSGVWKDFSTGQAGDPFELVTVCLGLNKKEALAWSIDWLGWQQDPSAPTPKPRRPKAPPKNDKQDQAEVQARQDKALEIWKAASPMAPGSVAAGYLARRGIHLDSFPRSLRYAGSLWHGPSKAAFPAMVAAIQTPSIAERDAPAPITGVHRTFLNRDGTKVTAKPQKMMAGTMKGGAIRLGPVTERLYVAEGIETALSVMMALGGGDEAAVWVAGSVGNFKDLVLPSAVRELIICADGDGSDGAERATITAADYHARAGLAVSIARPPAGQDFNDVLCGT